jgi:hypothetical protein
MKTAIYIEDGTVQLVITPETDFEKNALSTFQDHELEAKIYSGSFYDCRGGWVRQAGYFQRGYEGVDNNDKSLIMTIKTNENNQGVKPDA